MSPIGFQCRTALSTLTAALLLLTSATPALARGAGPIRAENPGPAPTVARITSPEAGQRVKGVVPIVGTATLSGAPAPYTFQSYVLAWGAGGDPSTYTDLASGVAQVGGGQLATWDTSVAPDGPAILRLRMVMGTGNFGEVRVPLIVDNGGRYAGPVFPVSDPPARPGLPQPSAVVLSSSTYTDPISGQLHVVGEVQNNGNANLDFVQVTDNLLDAAGNVAQSATGYTLLPILVPGQTSPFDVYTRPQPGTRLDPHVVVAFQVAPAPPAPGLALSADHLVTDSQGQLHLVGYLTNSSRDATAPYQIIYTLYDASGTPIRAGAISAMTSVAANPSPMTPQLAPGASGDFDYTIPNPPPAVASYSLAVQ